MSEVPPVWAKLSFVFLVLLYAGACIALNRPDLILAFAAGIFASIILAATES